MIVAPSVSVIVVSRHRADALARCLEALKQQDHPDFEVIVAADPAGLARIAGAPITPVLVDHPNIAKARNAAIGVASGEVVAFIDDDAVPESTWLTRLTDPLGDPSVTAATGYVLGRNGISLQWGAGQVTTRGETEPLDVPKAGGIARPAAGRAVKLLGTNCAIRRDALLDLGGFDPAFRFYLDDADLSCRLERSGAAVWVVPGAVVHHGFLASARRRADRVPRDLHDIGASTQAFLLRHSAPSDHALAIQAFRSAERRRLLRHMVTGALEPRDVRRLMQTLDAGLAEGRGRVPHALVAIPATERAFLRFPSGSRPGQVLSGRSWQAVVLRRRAAEAVRAGKITTLFLLSPTALYHRVVFTADGVWEQRGGLFGRSRRDGPVIRLTRFKARVAEECARVRLFRPV